MTSRVIFSLFLMAAVCACDSGKSNRAEEGREKEKSSYGQAIDKAKDVDRLISNRDYEKEAEELSE